MLAYNIKMWEYKDVAIMWNKRKSRGSDHDLFAELFVRHQAQVYRYIVTLVPNRSDADDLFQQTNLTLWKKWDRYDRSREFLPWACGIALNHIRNFWRKRKDKPVVFDTDIVYKLSQLRFNDRDVLQQRQEALTDCLEKLPPQHRHMVERYYQQSGTIKSIAEREGRNLKAVYKMLERIRTTLYECINRRVAQEV